MSKLVGVIGFFVLMRMLKEFEFRNIDKPYVKASGGNWILCFNENVQEI